MGLPSQSPPATRSLWEALGFRRNPYDVSPLRVEDEDIHLFVGREVESHHLRTAISAASDFAGHVVVVEGDVGVGKTSFVNAHQYQYLTKQGQGPGAPRLLPFFQGIDLSLSSEPVQFCLSVLSNALFSLKSKRILEGKTVSRSKGLARLDGWLNQLLVGEGKPVFSLTTPVVGLGGGGRQAPVPVPASQIPFPVLGNQLSNLAEEVRSAGFDGLFVPLENTDVLSEDDLLELLNRLRDPVLLCPSFCWVIVGRVGLFSLLETRARRVSERVSGEPTRLPPLTVEELLKAIEIRIRTFRRDNRVRPPVPQEVIRRLYDISNGETRFVFKRATDLLIDYRSRYPTASEVPVHEAFNTLRRLAEHSLENVHLTATERKKLELMARKREFRPTKDYAYFQLKSAQALNKYLQKFVGLSLLTCSKSGREAVYRTRGDVNLLFPAEGGPAEESA